MPLRPLQREQAWLLPPSLNELLSEDHSARFVAAFVDGLSTATLAELAIDKEGDALGAPAYHPCALLSVWLYGFMTGVRSSRKLEAACHDQIPLLWLTGCQRPDHNTLWRFYRSHRSAMRRLLKETVAIAVSVGYVDLALQALDGTKVAANAAGDQTYDAAGLVRLLERTDAAIAALEAQNETNDDAPPPPMPPELRRAHSLKERVQAARERLALEQHKNVNLTDGDARLMKGRQGIMPAYNAQAIVSPVGKDPAESRGVLITAVDVVDDPTDYAQLAPMLEEAEQITGVRGSTVLADAGYHTGANLEAGHERGQTLVIPERPRGRERGAYFKDRFVYDQATDSYRCPEGQVLPFRSMRKANGKTPIRLYRAPRAVCRACPAFGVCTKDKHSGRALWIGPHDIRLRQHRAWMETEEANLLYAQRKGLIEPVFGIIKEQLGARRFLLRGLENVRAEFALLATAFNLRTLWKRWATGLRPIPHLS